MEFLITPVHRGNLPIPIPRTPCASLERYELVPWMLYPAQKGLTASEGYKAEAFDLTEYHRSQRINPTPVNDLEAFFQRWLYFGLIAEFVGINSNIGSSAGTASNKTLDRIYKAVLVRMATELMLGLTALAYKNFWLLAEQTCHLTWKLERLATST
jgi:hypothetical protein